MNRSPRHNRFFAQVKPGRDLNRGQSKPIRPILLIVAIPVQMSLRVLRVIFVPFVFHRNP